MKKIKFLLGLALIGGVLTSCAPETIPADSDSTPDGKYTVNYSVQVRAIGNVSRGLSGASVTVQTQNGVTTKSVDANGIAVFEGLNAGSISGYVSAPGYAAINFTAYCAPQHQDVNTNGYVSSVVYLPAMNAGANGRIYGDFDQDGNTMLTDPDNFRATDIFVKYGVGMGYPMGAGDGALTSVSLDYNTWAFTTNSNGTFALADLPNTDMGYFMAQLRMQDFVYTDPVTSSQTIINIGNVNMNLQPGETAEMADIYAF